MSEQRAAAPGTGCVLGPGLGYPGNAQGLKETSPLGPSLQRFLKPITWLISAKLVISLFDIILFSKAASLHKGLGI